MYGYVDTLTLALGRAGERKAKGITDAAIKAMSDHAKNTVKERLGLKSSSGGSSSGGAKGASHVLINLSGISAHCF